MSRRLKSLATLVLDLRDQGDLPYIALEHLAGGTGALEPGIELPIRNGGDTGVSAVRPGDVLFGKLRPYLAKTLLIREPAYASTELLALRPSQLIEARYFAYLVGSRPFIEWATASSDGTKMPRTSWEKLGEFRLQALPDLDIQRTIADYLDRETARIDALITKKQRMIELLVARRLSAIEENLGGGQGAAAYLVGSETTLHRAVPLKRLLSTTVAGGTPDSNDGDYWTDAPGGVAWVAIGDMVDCSTTTDTSRRLTPLGLSASRLRVAPAGVLLFAMYASLGKLTVTAVPCVWNQAIIGLVPDEMKADAEYVALWLEALRPHLSLLARSTTQDNLNAEQVRSLPVPLVAVEKQRALVLRLLPVLQQISRTRLVLERQIDLLRERRQALITAAVTGELEVPRLAA